MDINPEQLKVSCHVATYLSKRRRPETWEERLSS